MDQYYEYLQSCIVGEQYIFEANYIYEYKKEIIMNEGVMDTLRSIKEAFFDFVDSVIDFIRGIVGKVTGIFKKSNSEKTENKLKEVQKNLNEEVTVNAETDKIVKGVQSTAGTSSTTSNTSSTPTVNQKVVRLKDAKTEIFKYDLKYVNAINSTIPSIAEAIQNEIELRLNTDSFTGKRGANNRSAWETFTMNVNGIVRQRCEKYSNDIGVKSDLSGSAMQMMAIFDKNNAKDSKTEVTMGNAVLMLMKMNGECNKKFDDSIKFCNKIINTFEKFKKDLGLKFKEIEIKENDKGYKKGTYQLGNVISNMYTTGINICSKGVKALMSHQANYKTKIDTDIKRVEAEIRK